MNNELDTVLRAKNGDFKATLAMEIQYTPLMHQVANSFYIPGYEKEDRLQEMKLAFSSAIEDYDPSRGAKFGTHVNNMLNWAKKEIIRRHTAKLRDERDRIVGSLDSNFNVSTGRTAPNASYVQNAYSGSSSSFSEIIGECDTDMDLIEMLGSLTFLSTIEIAIVHLIFTGMTINEIALFLKKTPERIKQIRSRIELKATKEHGLWAKI